MAADAEDDALRNVALRNANAILQAQRRAEEQVIQATRALQARSLELHRSLSLMQATLESTADAIVAIGTDGRILACNQRYADLYGRSREQMEGAMHKDMLGALLHEHPQRDQVVARIDEINARHGDEALDIVDLGTGQVFERFSRPQLLDGSVIGRVWSLRDITQRVRAEDSLREEARVLDLLNRTGQTIAASLDLRSILQSVTDAATQLSGAEIGAFFYNTTDAATGDAYQLYTLSRCAARGLRKFRPSARHAAVRPDLQRRSAGAHRRRAARPALRPVGDRTTACRPATCRCAATSRSRWGRAPAQPSAGCSSAIRSPAVFTERTQRLVVGIAAQASVAIDNARLYEQTQRVAEERERLVEAERAARVETARVSQLKDEFLADPVARAAHAADRDPRLGQGAAEPEARRESDRARLERRSSATRSPRPA